MIFKMLVVCDFVIYCFDEFVCNYVYVRCMYYCVFFCQIIGMFGLQVVVSVVLLGFGGVFVICGELMFGQFVVFELIVIYVVSLIVQMGKYFELFYDLMVVMDKFGNLFDFELECFLGDVWLVLVLSSDCGVELKLQGVDFFLRLGCEYFDVFLIDIVFGECVGFIGFSGFGKSMFFEMFYGNFEFEVGFFEIDGVDVCFVCFEVLCECVVLILLIIEVFEGLIFDNIFFGCLILFEQFYDILCKVGLFDVLVVFLDGVCMCLMLSGVLFFDGEIY